MLDIDKIDIIKEKVALNKLLVAAELDHDLRVYHWKLEHCSVFYKAAVKSRVLVFSPDKKIDYSGNSYTSIINDETYFPDSLVSKYESVCVGYTAHVLPVFLEAIHAM